MTQSLDLFNSQTIPILTHDFVPASKVFSNKNDTKQHFFNAALQVLLKNSARMQMKFVELLKKVLRAKLFSEIKQLLLHWETQLRENHIMELLDSTSCLLQKNLIIK